MEMPKIVDLFSGCGGFGLGAELAGFKSVVAVDIDPKLISAYKENFPTTKTVLSDLSTMGADHWNSLLGDQRIDGVIGGPPCQGFSRIGRRDKEDPRRGLLGDFFRTVNIIKPSFFIMENVEGLLDDGSREGLELAISDLNDGYTVLEPFIVDASDFGAATRRRRVLVIGFDSSRVSEMSCLDFQPSASPSISVWQAIRDVSTLVDSHLGQAGYGWARYKKGGLSEYARKMRALPPAGLGSSLAREKLQTGFFSGGFDTKHSEAVIARFRDTLAGKVEPVSRYPRLSKDGLCPTLRAGTGSDRGNFQAMRPIHPLENRVITVREAARLQGFPDWFLFHKTKHHSFRMIGNSVSPILSEAVLRKIKGFLSVDVKNRKRVA